MYDLGKGSEVVLPGYEVCSVGKGVSRNQDLLPYIQKTSRKKVCGALEYFFVAYQNFALKPDGADHPYD